MEQLIKITSEPMRMVRFSQNARLVSSQNVDMERRKAVARQMSMRNSAGQGGISVEDIKRINHTFSKKNISSQVPEGSAAQKVVARQPQPQPQIKSSVPSSESMISESVPMASADSTPAAPVSNPAPAPVQDVPVDTSYTAQKGAFEMRVAKGELTYLPPMVMTIITQRPSVHVEYLGDFNYVPPRDGDSGGNVNLAT